MEIANGGANLGRVDACKAARSDHFVVNRCLYGDLRVFDDVSRRGPLVGGRTRTVRERGRELLLLPRFARKQLVLAAEQGDVGARLLEEPFERLMLLMSPVEPFERSEQQ